ncbi:MAG: radical SAM protein [Crenarchaeota archaeon]|nr:radical SAM protein [Thermoproteota archaeon]
MARRGGISALFAAFKMVLGNPIARTILRIGTEEVACRYGDEVVKAPIVSHALALYAGEKVSCPVTARFAADLIRVLVKVGVAIMGGRDDEVKEAFRDPALRKGVATVMKGIAMYGITVPQKLPAPFMIVWNFTNMCNFRCKHCYQRADKPLPNELSFREKLKVIEELDAAGVPAVALSGGEPTIHPDYLYIIKAAAKKGMYTAVATNGWRFADIDELRKAKEAGLRYVEISLDSANPRKHDEFRGVEGAWNRAVKALENAVKLGLSHAMAITLTRMNVDEIDDLLDLAESIGVKRVVFFNFVPTGRAVDIVHTDLDPVTREKVMRRLYREMQRRKMEIVTTAPQFGRVVIQMSGGKAAAPTHFVARGDPATTALAEFVGGCGAGRIYAAIQPDGTVAPCVFMPIPRGSLREKSFWEIWSSDPLMNALRDKNNLKGFCGRCPYRFVCGGCRARAYGYFRDPLAPDPGCIFNLREWRKIEREIARGAKAVPS